MYTHVCGIASCNPGLGMHTELELSCLRLVSTTCLLIGTAAAFSTATNAVTLSTSQRTAPASCDKRGEGIVNTQALAACCK